MCQPVPVQSRRPDLACRRRRISPSAGRRARGAKVICRTATDRGLRVVSTHTQALEAGDGQRVFTQWSCKKCSTCARGGRHMFDSETIMIGQSPAIDRVRALVARVAPTEASVLLVGESGSGKELVAKSIHDQSLRSRGPFLAVELRCTPADPHRGRAVRLREGQLHGRRADASWAFRTRRWRHAVPR